jgi:hypothetical protein
MAELNVLVFSSQEDGNSKEDLFNVTVPDDIIPMRFLEIETNRLDWIDLNSELCYDCRFVALLQEELHLKKYEVNDPEYWKTEGFIVGLNGVGAPNDFDYTLIVDRIGTPEFLP